MRAFVWPWNSSIARTSAGWGVGAGRSGSSSQWELAPHHIQGGLEWCERGSSDDFYRGPLTKPGRERPRISPPSNSAARHLSSASRYSSLISFAIVGRHGHSSPCGMRGIVRATMMLAM